jgi:hypothetical protein
LTAGRPIPKTLPDYVPHDAPPSPFRIGFLILVGLTVLSFRARAATELVDSFGVDGWYSWDTRNTSGTALNGTNDTSPSINSTLLGRSVGSASTGDDAAIGQQVIFMDEGQTVNDNGDAAGNPPPASPLGSTGSLGYVRLDGTGSNSGKSDLSYVNTSGIAPGSALTDPSFGLSYRYYIQPQPTFRTLGLNIALTNNAQSNLYIFAYVDPAAVTGWNTSSVSASSGQFTLFANGSSADGGASMTLAQWSTDPTFGPQIFGGTENVFRVGFNVGSGQRDNLQYLDSMQTNLLNGGDLIDFVGPSAVPEASTWMSGMLAAGTIGVFTFRRRRKVA